MTERVSLAGLIPTAFQTLTLSNSTAQALNSTVRNSGASVLLYSVETNNARMRADGTSPTLTTGVLLSSAASPYWFYGFSKTSVLKFQRTTGTSKISVQAFKIPGDQK